jgi:hypothetical protein
MTMVNFMVRIGSEMNNKAWMMLVLGLAAAGFLVVAVFDPMQYDFYPKCMLHSTTGLSCAGCGGLRAVHALGRGDVAEAVRLNPLIVVGFPLVGLVWLAWRWRERRQPPSNRRSVPNALIWCGLALLIVFGILRNIPVPALSWLAP